MQIVAAILTGLVVVSLFGFFFLKYRMANATDANNLQAAIDEEILKFARQPNFRGLAIGVYKDGKSFFKGYGALSETVDTPPDATTIFQIASVSKLFTATVLQMLCDEGVVGMDSTLAELIGHSVPLSAAARQVTLRRLATHTSGFPRIPRSLEAKAIAAAKGDDPLLDPYSHLGSEHVFDYLATTEDKKAAGRFEYSNFGMGLLAHVLERVTGKDFESLVSEKILVPLGMDGTSITLSPALQARLAQGHSADGTPTPAWRFAALAGAGAIHSSVQDMVRFIQANVEKGRLLSTPFEKMREPQFNGETGIGWMQSTWIDRFLGNEKVVWHNGMVGGYSAYLSVHAETRTGVVILTNKALPADMVGMLVMRKVRTQSWSL